MDNTLLNALRLLGLSSKEIKFFETSFRMGPAPINQVAKAARLHRSTAYIICQELLDKGLLEEDLHPYQKHIFAITPQKILQFVAGKQRQLRRQELELAEKLPELQALYENSEILPKVRVYEGHFGLIQVWKDILSAKGELLLWTNQQTDKLVFGPQKHLIFREERVRKKIYARVLAVDNLEGQALQEIDKDYFRETRILPKQTQFTPETYIYDNKVAILDYNKDIIGVIMESAPISVSQKAFFELTWEKIKLD